MTTSVINKKLQRKTFSFDSRDPILNYIQILKGTKFKANTEVEIIKIGISKLVEDLNLQLVSRQPDEWEKQEIAEFESDPKTIGVEASKRLMKELESYVQS